MPTAPISRRRRKRPARATGRSRIAMTATLTPRRSEVIAPTHSASTICSATWRSGRRTAGIRTTAARQRMGAHGPAGIHCAPCAAARGRRARGPARRVSRRQPHRRPGPSPRFPRSQHRLKSPVLKPAYRSVNDVETKQRRILRSVLAARRAPADRRARSRRGSTRSKARPSRSCGTISSRATKCSRCSKRDSSKNSPA